MQTAENPSASLCRRVVIVTSRKGGVGKSTLAAHLGAALAEQGRSVVLCDCDFGVRCLDILCGVSDSVLYDLGDVALGRIAPERALTEVRDGLKLLVSPLSVKPDAAQLTAAFSALIPLCGCLLLDTPRDSLEDVARAALSASREAGAALTAAVVSTPYPMSVRAGELTGRELDSLGIRDVRLVVNLFDADKAASGRQPDIVGLIDGVCLPLLGILPYDPDIADAQSAGRLSGELKAPNSRCALRNLAGRLEGRNIPLLNGFRRVNRRKALHI